MLRAIYFPDTSIEHCHYASLCGFKRERILYDPNNWRSDLVTDKRKV
jgi:hypothetical protein